MNMPKYPSHEFLFVFDPCSFRIQKVHVNSISLNTFAGCNNYHCDLGIYFEKDLYDDLDKCYEDAFKKLDSTYNFISEDLEKSVADFKMTNLQPNEFIVCDIIITTSKAIMKKFKMEKINRITGRYEGEWKQEYQPSETFKTKEECYSVAKAKIDKLKIDAKSNLIYTKRELSKK